MGKPGRFAVIDIGSNSVRLVVIQRRGRGNLEILADSRAALRLARALDARGRIRREAIERTIQTLRDFQALAQGAGVEETIAVATAAVRSSRNAADFVRRVRAAVGLRVEVIASESEAYYAFLGAVRGLPVEHGVLIDIGGGSIQLTHFRKRRMVKAWSLPFGSLSLTDRYVRRDPPTDGEVRRIRRAVLDELKRSGVPGLRADEILLGTGGTIRNVAKIDHRARSYPIHRLHGYVVSASRVREIVSLVTSLARAKRSTIPGLNSDRADSIVGGAVALDALLARLGAPELTVAGQGLREGLLFASPGERPGARPRGRRAARIGRAPAPEAVRRASIAALGARFSTWNAETARGRIALAGELWRVLASGKRTEVAESLRHAAAILDIGRSIDYYARFVHTARILLATDLLGFSHRQLALVSAIVYLAGNGEGSLKTFRPLLSAKDRKPVERAAAVLALAEEIEKRIRPGRAPALRCTMEAGVLRVEAPIPTPLRSRRLAARFRRLFGRSLIVRAANATPLSPGRAGSAA
jgi:exopolyphosphatase/guanosine-5'-triphosphate,3'-diphosphate pyrophosphatase